MKILYVITCADRGGAQVHLASLLAHLPAEIEATVATGEDGFLCVEALKSGIPVRRIPNLTRSIRPLKDLRALIELVWTIRRESPDLIHAHTSKAGLLARFAARMMGRRVVFTAHTWSFAEGIPRNHQWFAIPLERLAATLGGKIIAVSQANKDMAVRHSIASADSIVRIWNGVPDVPERAAPGSGDTLTLIMIARFVPQKDHLLLIEALKGLDGNWKLLLVGDGGLRRSIEDAISSAGLRHRIECLGERVDTPLLLASADLFVLATKVEGLPLTILEAMRSGLPVVATDVGGVSEAVTDGITGYLTSPGDSRQMRERIGQLIASRQLLKSMGASARARYERDFRVETMTRATFAVYREVMFGASGDHFAKSAHPVEI